MLLLLEGKKAFTSSVLTIMTCPRMLVISVITLPKNETHARLYIVCL